MIAMQLTLDVSPPHPTLSPLLGGEGEGGGLTRIECFSDGSSITFISH
jgi:hypothetical protein